MLKKNLVIVESPAKARTISKFLGRGYEVVSSMGHVVDLPASRLGIEIEHDYKTELVVIPKKKKLLSELRKMAKDAEAVYFATDPDREGEAIGWNLKERMELDKQKIFRVEFHEITRGAIEAAFSSSRAFNEDRIKAQQARRILDRIVGYFLSPLLWRKITRGLSAGRVQSVALRLVVDRERQVQAFISQEYWSIEAELRKKDSGPGPQDVRFIALLDKKDAEKVQIASAQAASNIVAELQGKPFAVSSVEKNFKNRNPLPPFITSSLQQDAFNKLHFSAQKTMVLAQQLYEGIELGEEGPVGLITYMRTDSTQIAQTAIAELRSYIQQVFGRQYLPDTPRVYRSRKSAQEAHEAIRPTSVARTPKDLASFLTNEQLKLYELIWKRFAASQMNPAKIELTTVIINCGQYSFRATGSLTVFDGFLAVYRLEEETQEAQDSKGVLPILAKDDGLQLLKLTPLEHWTKPPARYSEGSLIKALEEEGVGRPSTYAPTIATIIARDYVRREKGYLRPTELGMKVSDLLVSYFPQIMDVSFTARMEEELDLVEDGKINWINILNEFYAPFKEKLDFALTNIKKEVVYSQETCSVCGKPMVIKWGRRGKFLSCSAYPECKNAKSISSGVKCPESGCGGDLVLRRSKRGRSFYGCGNYPKCRWTGRSLPQEELPKPEVGDEPKSETT